MHVLTRKARVIVPRQYQAVLCGVKENTTSLRADIVVELWHAFKTGQLPELIFTNINKQVNKNLAYVTSLTFTKLDVKIYKNILLKVSQ